jgi:hypothetical protein
LTVYESDTYLTNGHWLIWKEKLTPKTLDFIRYKSKRVIKPMTDAELDRCIPDMANLTAWTVSELTTTVSNTRVRLLESAVSGKEAAIALNYADWLGLAPGMTVYGNDARSPFRSASADVVVMPVQL